MLCRVCGRHIKASAVLGQAIGPVCAQNLGLLPTKLARPRIVDAIAPAPNPAQLDWVTDFNAGRLAGESLLHEAP